MKKNIALFGANTSIGQRILKEALARGHKVTAIVPDIHQITTMHDNLKVVEGNITDTTDVSAEVEDHDVVINAEGPDPYNANTFVETTHSLIEGVKKAGVQRLIAVGGAPELKAGSAFAETEHISHDWQAVADAHRNALALYQREKQLLWSYSHPTAFLEAGKKTGRHVRQHSVTSLGEIQGTDSLSLEDYATVLLDEAENNEHVQEPFEVTY
jgi:putative NADH-flavin reductase